MANESSQWQRSRSMATDLSPEQDSVIWCPSCGIPHEVTATHCSLCHQPLVDIQAGSDGPNDDTAAEAPGTQTATLGRTLAAQVVTQRPPRQRRAAPWPVQRPRQALTDDEIEARAAMIVALARKEEAVGVTVSPDADGLKSVTDDELLELDFLPPLRQRDREWLLAGLICCVLLIMGAVAIVRFFAV
jgi:hypothetical protein